MNKTNTRKKKMKNRNFLEALKNSINGISYTIKTQRNLKIQMVIAIIVIMFGIRFKLNTTEWIGITVAIMLVFITEMINTAIESAVDLATGEYHKLAKIAKDVAAGAVLLSSLNAVIIAILILVGKQ